jgi:hypothetical protein
MRIDLPGDRPIRSVGQPFFARTGARVRQNA